jgi:hypothetical protein
LDLKAQTVNNELRKLESAGMLHRTDPEGRKVFLIGTKSGFWDLCQELESNAKTLLDNVRRY